MHPIYYILQIKLVSFIDTGHRHLRELVTWKWCNRETIAMMVLDMFVYWDERQ